MKTLDDIWEEHLNQETVSAQTIQGLIWHIENDADPMEAIIMAADMGLKKLSPYIAKHLENEDDYIRELTIGCLLGQLQLVEYAKQGFKMAVEDPYDNVKNSAIFSIGEVMNQIMDRGLQYKIACYLYQILIGPDRAISFKRGAYNSILAAMGVSSLERPRVRDLGKDIDFDLLERFKKKYGIHV